MIFSIETYVHIGISDEVAYGTTDCMALCVHTLKSLKVEINLLPWTKIIYQYVRVKRSKWGLLPAGKDSDG